MEGILDATSLDLFGWIPEDGVIGDFDFKGKSMIDLPNDSASVVAVRGILLGVWGGYLGGRDATHRAA